MQSLRYELIRQQSQYMCLYPCVLLTNVQCGLYSRIG